MPHYLERAVVDLDKCVLGTQLNAADQAHVLATFVHRYTMEHKPVWARPFSVVQFASDADWLAHTKFQVCAKWQAG